MWTLLLPFREPEPTKITAGPTLDGTSNFGRFTGLRFLLSFGPARTAPWGGIRGSRPVLRGRPSQGILRPLTPPF